jgi:hypothetical protein
MFRNLKLLNTASDLSVSPFDVRIIIVTGFWVLKVKMETERWNRLILWCGRLSRRLILTYDYFGVDGQLFLHLWIQHRFHNNHKVYKSTLLLIASTIHGVKPIHWFVMPTRSIDWPPPFLRCLELLVIWPKIVSSPLTVRFFGLGKRVDNCK